MDVMIQSLLRSEAYDHPVTHIELLQTHISWVILTGPFAYKIKKPVNFGFVNFTTLEDRERYCHEEVRLNQRLAEELYLGVVPIYGPDEQASFIGSGSPIEFAVKMRQFSQDELLPAVLARGELTPSHLDRFAEALALFQDQAAIATAVMPFGDPESVRQPVEGNLIALRQRPEYAEVVDDLDQWGRTEFQRLTEVFRERKQAGRVRECHGDLHLGNLILHEGRIAAFDCLEFNANLRWIDVISEMAFLVMDLSERGRPDYAFRVLNHWLEQTGDYSGLTTWRWYFCYRALVRAKVAVLRMGQGEQAEGELRTLTQELETYLQLAIAWTQPRPTGIVVTHGVSGTGKSFVTQKLCEALNAIRLRSDVERKRLFGEWGIPRVTTLNADMYCSAVSQRVYQTVLLPLVTKIVESGFPVIIDATFLNQQYRSEFQVLARQLSIPFVILEFEGTPDQWRERIRERQQQGTDPSDADVTVLEQQLAIDEPLTEDERHHAISVPSDRSDLSTLIEAIRQRWK